MKNFLLVILMIWFVVINLFVFIPSYYALTHTHDAAKAANAPELPNPPVLNSTNGTEDTLKANQLKVDLYTEDVKAYSQALVAYQAYIGSMDKYTMASTYQLVVKETLLGLLTSFITALLAYVFVKTGASLADNYVRMKNNQPPVTISLF